MSEKRDLRGSGQEQALLDYVQRLDRFRSGRRAVHVHFSRLRPYHRRDHHLRIASTTFDKILRRFEGGVFRLSNNDMVVVTKGASVADLDAAVVQLRFLFSEDPVVDLPDEDPNRFVTWYDLENDYPALLALAESLERQRRDAASAPQPLEPLRAADSLPVGPAEVGKIERALANADLANVIRRQPVCFAAPGQPPIPMFHELYVSTADLSQIVAPGYNLLANRWLFQYLTQVLDQRMLAYLLRREDSTLARDFSLNLNVATCLSPEFLQFDREVNAVAQGTVLIELQQIDIFADPGSFMFARDFLKERGYRLCVDGVRHLALPLIDREQLGVEFVKFEWGYGMVDEQSTPRALALKDAVRRIGQDRLILCRCDSPEALQIGRDLGIAMYQGRYFDSLLQDVSRRQAPAAKRAAG